MEKKTDTDTYIEEKSRKLAVMTDKKLTEIKTDMQSNKLINKCTDRNSERI